MKVALYARVSTDDDEDRLAENGEKVPRQDPEVQIDHLKEYCRMREFAVVKEYSERKSGADDDRPVLRDMINDAKRCRHPEVGGGRERAQIVP